MSTLATLRRARVSLFGALGLPAALVALLACSEPAPAEPSEPTEPTEAASASLRDWTLVYLLPYDNDLAPYADPILAALEAGIVDDRVAVLALVDRPGPGGSERVILTRGRREVRTTTFEASAHPAVIGRLLDRAVADLPARRYAFFLLDHGGALDQVGLDEHPAGGPSWMPARGAARALAEWRTRHGRRLDLLVLQQCNRATLESHHLFGPEADVIVASQGLLSAPNGYYGSMLRAIAGGRAESAEALATAIIEAEPPDGFVELTAVRGPALAGLPPKLDAVLAPLVSASAAPSSEDERAAADALVADALVLVWQDEAYVDLFTFLRALYAAQRLDPAPVDALAALVSERVFVHRRLSPRAPHAAHLGGLSMLLPRGPGVLERYADLPLYQASSLAALARRHPQPPSEPGRPLPGQIAPRLTR